MKIYPALLRKYQIGGRIIFTSLEGEGEGVLSRGNEASSKVVEDRVEACDVPVSFVFDYFFDDDSISNVSISGTFVLARMVFRVGTVHSDPVCLSLRFDGTFW